MKNYQLFVGIDVSKLTLDVSLYRDPDANQEQHQKFENNKKGIKQLVSWVKSSYRVDASRILYCLEHTGVYAYPVCGYLSEKKLHFALVPALQIKRSLGIKRGKNDKADSKAIAYYAWLHRNDIETYRMPDKIIMSLKVLLSYRERLVKAKGAIQVSALEIAKFVDKQIVGDMVKDSRAILKKLEERIKALDTKLVTTIQSDEKMKKAYDLAITVPGIGPQIASNLIVSTRCFTCFKDWRKYSCYIGTAPFEYTSGSSIRGKSRVSKLGNKKMKSLLNMGALNAMRHDLEIKNYYNRKTAEGKNPMLVINAIRNKLISRVFATINRGTPFVKTAQYLR